MLLRGQRAQVGFGEKLLLNINSGRTKVYAVAFVLAHSRYKYVELQSPTFTATDLVRACHRCFRYIGGMPRELVFGHNS